MKYKRYGQFRFYDYISAWLVIVFLFVLVVIGFLTGMEYYLLIWPIVLLMNMIWSVYKPNIECFYISNDTIVIMQGRKKKVLSIPSEPTLVISYADVCPPLAKRIGYGNQTYMLKNRCAVSILQKIDLETALEQLHQNYTYKYTNSTVENCFSDDVYVYSFVYDQSILDELISNRNCHIIIPETLLNQISIGPYQPSVHIDKGY